LVVFRSPKSGTSPIIIIHNCTGSRVRIWYMAEATRDDNKQDQLPYKYSGVSRTGVHRHVARAHIQQQKRTRRIERRCSKPERDGKETILSINPHIARVVGRKQPVANTGVGNKASFLVRCCFRPKVDCFSISPMKKIQTRVRHGGIFETTVTKRPFAPQFVSKNDGSFRRLPLFCSFLV